MTIDIDAIRHRQAKLESLADQGATGLKSEAYVMAVALAANLSAADVPDLLAELDKVRAQLADTQKRAHTDATNLQQILRDKTALANERDALKQQLAEAREQAKDSAYVAAQARKAVVDLRQQLAHADEVIASLRAAIDADDESEVAR